MKGLELIPVLHRSQTKFWLHHLERVPTRRETSLMALLESIDKGEMRILYVWDEGKQFSKAAMGVRDVANDFKKGLDVVWAAGNRRAIEAILPQLEAYARDCGADVITETGRLGWEPVLARHGWKATQVTMEKDLRGNV
jgi:hypothetical protein